MIYREILNYTTIIMKNKPKNYFKKTKNIFDNLNNIDSESNNINNTNSKKSNYNEFKNSNGIINSNELSFLIFSSNKDTNKYKRDVLFGNLLSINKEEDKIKFNSLLKDSIKSSNSFKLSNIYNNLENSIRDNQKNSNFFLTSEKNKLKNNNSQINYLSSIKNKNYNNTSIKIDCDNLFVNENNFSLNDYLNLYQNDDNIENNCSNVNEHKENNSPAKEFSKINNNLDKISKSPKFSQAINKNKKLEIIIEERKKENIKRPLMNEELFNTHIKKKISKIKNDIIINNNLKHKNDEDKKKYK